MPSAHSIRAAAAATLLAIPLATEAQPTPPVSETGAATFTVFLRGLPIGSEQIALARTADGWVITGSGRIGAPIDLITRSVQVRYTPDWRPVELTLDATARGQLQTVHTVVDAGTAKTTVSANGQPTEKTDAIDSAAVVILPSTVFAPYEALAARLKTAAPGSDIPIYRTPVAALTAHVGESSAQQIQTTARMISAHRTRITMAGPGVPVTADVWTDEAGRMIRLSLPAQTLEVVREDLAAVSSRSVPISRPNDEALSIPSNGFSLAATLSKPSQATAPRQPAVVLVGASGPIDRDGLSFGIPILGEIAGALSDAGFIVVRYDKRGIGQSGGRAESASFTDYADDVRSAVKVLSERKDVDRKRIAVIGYSEGAIVAMMAAAKDKRIAAVGLIAAPGLPGADIVLAQQKRLLDRSTLSAAEKQAKVDTQRQIHDAVISGKGLEKLPGDIRRAVDNAEFQSLLIADPAKIMPEIRGPVLIAQGELDTEIEPPNADRLEELAKKRKHVAPVEVARVPGVNHLLVPATTGEVDEYGKLSDRHVSPAVTQALVAWLKKVVS